MSKSAAVLTSLALLIFLSPAAQAEGPLRRMLPRKGPPTAGRQSSSDGMWIPGARLAKRTTGALGSAGERMMFWKDDEPKSNEFIEGTGRFFRPDLARKEQERNSFSLVRPASWFEPAPEPGPEPQTVHDWIGQPRPGFD